MAKPLSTALSQLLTLTKILQGWLHTTLQTTQLEAASGLGYLSKRCKRIPSRLNSPSKRRRWSTPPMLVDFSSEELGTSCELIHPLNAILDTDPVIVEPDSFQFRKDCIVIIESFANFTMT